LQATVHKWFEVKERTAMGEFEDICVLELSSETALPSEAQPIAILVLDSAAFFDRPVRRCGFPEGRDEGDWLSGKLEGTISNGCVQLETEGRRSVAPGFSGTAIWDKTENAVTGMMVSIQTGRQDTTAYMIPMAILINAWPELDQQTQYIDASVARREREKAKQKRSGRRVVVRLAAFAGWRWFDAKQKGEGLAEIEKPKAEE